PDKPDRQARWPLLLVLPRRGNPHNLLSIESQIPRPQSATESPNVCVAGRAEKCNQRVAASGPAPRRHIDVEIGSRAFLSASTWWNYPWSFNSFAQSEGQSLAC